MELRVDEDKARGPMIGRNILNPSNDTNRLVDQFYNAINEMNKSKNGSNNNSVVDMRQLLAGAGAVSGTEQNQHSVAETELLDHQFDHIINSGGYEYDPIHNKISLDDQLIHHFLNIDSILGSDHAVEAGLRPLRDILDSISERYLSQARRSIITDPLIPTTLVEVSRLQRYLRRLQALVMGLLKELLENKDEIKGRYRHEINDNIAKLSDLVKTLDTLEVRLNSSKTQINTNKSQITGEFKDKIETLEYVHKRYREYSQKVHDRRFLQLGAAIAVIIMVISIYAIL